MKVKLTPINVAGERVDSEALLGMQSFINAYLAAPGQTDVGMFVATTPDNVELMGIELQGERWVFEAWQIKHMIELLRQTAEVPEMRRWRACVEQLRDALAESLTALKQKRLH